MDNTSQTDPFVQADLSWKEKIMDIGRKETAVFESNNLAYTNELIKYNCRRDLMKWIYIDVCNYKKLSKIEDLPQDEKEALWSFVKDVCKGQTADVERMKDIARVFYIIEYFLNENNP